MRRTIGFVVRIDFRTESFAFRIHNACDVIRGYVFMSTLSMERKPRIAFVGVPVDVDKGGSALIRTKNEI